MSMHTYRNAIHMMEHQGGSFVKSLAACWHSADPTNRAVLAHAFATYFTIYEQRFAEHRKAATHAPVAAGVAA